MIRKGQACQCAPGGMAILVNCFLVGRSQRRPKFPIIYPDLRLDYKLATLPRLTGVSESVIGRVRSIGIDSDGFC